MGDAEVAEALRADGMQMSDDEILEAKAMAAKGHSAAEIAEWIGCETWQVEMFVAPRPASRPRTSGGLRDMLFDEIEKLQSGEADPARSVAVSKVAAQIVSVAKTELEFMRMLPEDLRTPEAVGQLQLGTKPHTRETSDATAEEAPAVGPAPGSDD